jgi:DNA-binding CsgD family transcriptional regulator
MKRKELTYRRFLDSVCEDCRRPIDKEEANAIMEHFQPANELISPYAPVPFLLDYTTKKYIHVGEGSFHVFGYTAKWFLESGVEKYLGIWHPDDYQVINTKVFPDNISFIASISEEDVSNYIVTYNYRMKNPLDKYLMILQRFSFIPGTGKQPAGLVGIAIDISHYKTDNTIVHTIEKIVRTKNGNITDLVFKKIHPVYDTPTPTQLTRREVEILQFLSKGMSSKQIAAQMSISLNTVSNHRKNMLAKTESKTSSELIKYALKHGLV